MADQTSASIEQKLAIIGRQLVSGIRGLVHALPGSVTRPQDLSKLLGINKDVSSRVFRALARTDPLAATQIMPGPAPLRQVLDGARQKGVPSTILRQADEAVAEFERLIRVDVGDRASLDAIISGALPETRQKYELINKQSVFRGMMQLKGVMADVLLTTAIILASETPEYVDGVWVLAWQGLRRVRRDAFARFHTGRIGEEASRDPTRTLFGKPIREPKDVLLDAYCSTPPVPIEAVQEDTQFHFALGGNGVGLSSAVDVVMACRTPRCLKRYDQAERRRLRGPTMEIELPCKLAVLDVFVEQKVFPEGTPVLRAYDTAVRGLADMNDPQRDMDRLDLRETLEFLGEGTAGIRILEIPQYSEIIAEVLQRIGRAAECFRGYRCRSQYPLYGTQFAVGFQAPLPPGEEEG